MHLWHHQSFLEPYDRVFQSISSSLLNSSRCMLFKPVNISKITFGWSHFELISSPKIFLKVMGLSLQNRVRLHILFNGSNFRRKINLHSGICGILKLLKFCTGIVWFQFIQCWHCLSTMINSQLSVQFEKKDCGGRKWSYS